MGTPAVASAGVAVWARTKNFDRNMKRSARGLDRFRKQTVDAARAAFRFGAVVTGVAAGAMTQLIRTSLRTMDTAAKTARKLGLTTEALVGLQHAAEIVGVEIRTFDMGLQRMTRRIAEAAENTGEAKAAIKELGLDAKKLDRLTTDQKFLEIADALSKVENQAQKVRLGFKLFDSEGVALINLTEGGREAIEALMAKAKMLGLTFDRDTAKAVEKLTNAFTDLKGSITGLGNAMAIKFTKQIETATKAITGFFLWIRRSKSSFLEFVTQMGKLAFKTVVFVTAMSGLVLLVNIAIKAFKGLISAYHLLSKAMILVKALQGPAGWAILAGATIAATAAIVAADKVYAGIAAEMGALDDASREAAAGMTALADETDAANKSILALEQRQKRIKGREDIARGRREAFGAQAAQIRIDLRTPSEVFRNEIDKLRMLYQRGVLDIETYDRALAQANEDFADTSGITALADAAKDAAEDMKRQGQALTQAMRTPRELWRQSMEDINALYLKGAISQEVWRRALEDAKKTLDKTSLAGAATFREVDVTRVAIGGGRRTRIQRTEEKNSAELLQSSRETTEAVKGLTTGLG